MEFTGSMDANGNLFGSFLLLGMKQSAWVTKTGQYSTDINEAKVFSRDEALTQARRHRDASNLLIPVRQEDMKAI